MTEQLKTVVFRDVKKIEIEEHPLPKVPDDMVLIKIHACAICTWEQRVYNGIKQVDFPFIGGHEFSGEIVEMGAKVSRNEWQIGDQVVAGVNLPCKNCYHCKSGDEQNCENFDHSQQLPGMPYPGMGGLSSHMLVHPVNLFHYKNVSPEEACIAEPVSCVVQSVENAHVQLGDHVLVIGCGIMGLLHVQLAAKKGAAVIVSDTNEERTAMALKMGAKYAVNPAKEKLRERVLEITDGLKCQAVFDTTPIYSVVEDAIKCVANKGRVILYSSFYPDEPVSFSPDQLHKGAYAIQGTANSNTRDFVRATRLLSEGIVDVKPFVSGVYAVDDVQEAFESAIVGDKFRIIVTF